LADRASVWWPSNLVDRVHHAMSRQKVVVRSSLLTPEPHAAVELVEGGRHPTPTSCALLPVVHRGLCPTFLLQRAAAVPALLPTASSPPRSPPCFPPHLPPSRDLEPATAMPSIAHPRARRRCPLACPACRPRWAYRRPWSSILCSTACSLGSSSRPLAAECRSLGHLHRGFAPLTLYKPGFQRATVSHQGCRLAAPLAAPLSCGPSQTSTRRGAPWAQS
jgi:hypothetical protein